MQKSKELIEYSVADVGEKGSHSRLKVGARLRWAEREGRNSVPRGATSFHGTLKVLRGACVSQRNTDNVRDWGLQASQRAD